MCSILREVFLFYAQRFPDVLPAARLALHAFIVVPNLNFTGKEETADLFFFFSRAECNRYGVIILTDFLKIEYFCPLHVKELIMFPLWHSKSILSALLSSNPLH